MRSEKTLMALGVLSLLATTSPAGHTTTRLPDMDVECAVTSPNGIAAGQAHVVDHGSFGNRRFVTQ